MTAIKKGYLTEVLSALKSNKIPEEKFVDILTTPGAMTAIKKGDLSVLRRGAEVLHSAATSRDIAGVDDNARLIDQLAEAAIQTLTGTLQGAAGRETGEGPARREGTAGREGSHYMDDVNR